VIIKRLSVFFLILLTSFAAVSCSRSGDKDAAETTPAPAGASGLQYADGVYFAQEDGFSEQSGWKNMVILVVSNGKITEAEWNGAHVSAGVDKITSSESGEYGMVAKGGAGSEWHEQAALAEEFLLEEQDPAAITYTNDEGNTDAISGVSIHVKEFFILAEKALAAGPVGYGLWEDGHYSAEAAEFSEETGWKSTMDLTVVGGYIVAANWDAVHKDGGDTKKVQSKDGRYGMVEYSDAQSEWYVQAEMMEALLLEKQDPAAIDYNEDGYTDAVSGVSVHVNDFVELSLEALEGSKR
jgi:major membrane immunogen (membrane-anchored lipoprotein)